MAPFLPPCMHDTEHHACRTLTRGFDSSRMLKPSESVLKNLPPPPLSLLLHDRLTKPRHQATNLFSQQPLPDDPFDMIGSGSPADPKLVDAGKGAAVEGAETSSATAQESIEAGRSAGDHARNDDATHLGSPLHVLRYDPRRDLYICAAAGRRRRGRQHSGQERVLRRW